MKKIFSIVLILSFFSLYSYGRTINFPDTTGYYEYIGTYKFHDGSELDEVKISFRDSTLFGSSEKDSSTLTKLGVDSFNLDSYNGTVVFKRDENNHVNRIIVTVDDNVMQGEKIEANVSTKRRKVSTETPATKS